MYQAIYKCRLCGEEFSDGETGERIANIVTQSLAVADSTAANLKYTLNIRNVHNCQDGSFGLADFQGFKKTEE